MTSYEFPVGPISVYKNRNAGAPRKAPRCICCFPGNRAGQIVPLKYGVTIALCERHRDPAWMRSESGRAFLSIVGTTFSSLGLKQPRFHQALDAFVRDLTTSTRSARPRPGSYAWPDLRRQLEGLWAEDSRFHTCGDAVSAHACLVPDGWKAPSAATVRRWWREKRWLLDRPSRAERERRPHSRRPAPRAPAPMAPGPDRRRVPRAAVARHAAVEPAAQAGDPGDMTGRSPPAAGSGRIVTPTGPAPAARHSSRRAGTPKGCEPES